MPSSAQPSAGVSAFALDAASAAVSRPSKAAARLRRGALRAPAAFECLDTTAGAVSNANADTPAEGCELDGIWISLDFRCHRFSSECNVADVWLGLHI